MLLFVTVCARACGVCVCVVEQKDRTPFGICRVNFQQNSCEGDWNVIVSQESTPAG